MKKIEHIGIAVNDLKKANKLYSDILGVNSYKTETVESENVITSFFKCGDTKIELLQGVGENSAISKFIKKKGKECIT